MDRYVGLDAHAPSCTQGVMTPSGKRIGSHVVETNTRRLIEAGRQIPAPRLELTRFSGHLQTAINGGVPTGRATRTLPFLITGYLAYAIAEALSAFRGTDRWYLRFGNWIVEWGLPHLDAINLAAYNPTEVPQGLRRMGYLVEEPLESVGGVALLAALLHIPLHLDGRRTSPSTTCSDLQTPIDERAYRNERSR